MSDLPTDFPDDQVPSGAPEEGLPADGPTADGAPADAPADALDGAATEGLPAAGLPAEGFGDAGFAADAPDDDWFATDDLSEVQFGEVAFTGDAAAAELAGDGFEPFEAAAPDAWQTAEVSEAPEGAFAVAGALAADEPVFAGDAGGTAFDATDNFFSGAAAPPPTAGPAFASLGDGAPPADGFADTFEDDPDADSAAAEEAVVAAPAKPRKKRASKGSKKETLVLGLHVTPKQVFGVLVRSNAEGYEPLRQFVRTRNEGAGGFDTADAFSGGALTPDTADGDDAFGGGDIAFGAAAEVDFSAEFAGMSAGDDDFDLSGIGSLGATRGNAQPILFEVKDILEECAQAGYDKPALAFTIGGEDVDYLEVVVEPDKKALAKKKKKGDAPAKPAAVKRDKLVALLPEDGPMPIDKERAAFLEMTPQNGMPRYLAVLPSPSEPVVPSLKMLREQREHRKTPFRAIEAEVPLLVGLADVVLQAQEHENTALVRVGAEDTLVLLIEGRVLRHAETMQSVTAFDGPDTICSRVLLQQDVQGVGTVHNVVVISEEREGEIVQGFAAFYPESRVEALRDGLARMGLVGPYGALPAELVEAAGAALAGHLYRADGPFGEASILPKDVVKTRRPVELAFGWHTLLVAVLFVMSVLFFVGLFVTQQGDIAEAERTLAEFPAEAQMSAPELQARIDSLRMRQAELTASMQTLDSLLVGTDKWTQALLKTTRAASATGGVWIEEWSPNGGELAINGYATSRDRVVGLAQRLTASIDELSFQEVREYPVYSYRMRFETPPELPQITRVMRQQAAEELAEPDPQGAVSGVQAAPADVGLDAAP